MMDVQGLDVGFIYKYENLFEDKEEEPLFTLIDQSLPRLPPSKNYLESVFSDSLEDELLPMSMYERNLIMRMQMTSGSSVDLSQTCHSGSLTSMEPLGIERDYQRMNAEWSTNYSSCIISDEDYENGRERKFSTSSYMGPCIPPDLIINNRLDSSSSTDEFLVDSFADIEDVQEQIFLEDVHQNLQPDDLLIPLDEPIDGKELQEQLINQITGNNQSLLAPDNSEANTNELLFNTLPNKSEVKKVETTPGSQNIRIDGVEVQLPTGSVILAVVNESGSLVPVPASTQPFNDDDDDVAADRVESGPVPGLSASVSASQLIDSIMLPGNQNVPSEPLLNGASEIEGFPRMNGLSSAGINELTSEMKGLVPIKTENSDDFFDDVEIGEEYIDIETISEKTPVIEAVDLDSLLAEFEATENVNKSLEKSRRNDGEVTRLPAPSIVPESAANNNLTPSETSSLIKVEKTLSREEIKRQAMAVGPPKLLSNVSIKVKKVETNKPVKSLIERKNQMMLKKMVAHRRIKDSLPTEIIEKIGASGKRSRTKILTEALIPRLKGKKFASNSKLLKKTNVSKRNLKKKNGNNIQGEKKSEGIAATPFLTDHDYCISPQKQLREKDKVDSSSNVYSKLPDYCRAPLADETKKFPLDGEDACKKDSGVESGDVSDSSIEIEEDSEKKCKEGPNKLDESASVSRDAVDGKNILEEENVYSRLPDYVTDIGNIKPKEGVEGEGKNGSKSGSRDSSSSSDTPKVEIKEEEEEEEEEPKKKRKLKLSEYRMRIRSSANNSRSSSPSVGEEILDKKEPKIEIKEEPIDIEQASPRHTLAITVTEEREEGEIKEEADDGDTQNIPQNAKVPIKVKTVPVPKNSLNGEIKGIKYSNNKPSKKIKKPTVIEIDLEEEEEEEERKNQKVQTKLGLIDSLPLSKMPTTSLGHSLLYSRKNGETLEKKGPKYDSGKSSGRHYKSSSRSRSRSWSSKRGSCRHRSKSSKYTSSHRKSRRRWSRSRSRGRSRTRSRSRSRSYSLSSSSSSSYPSVYSSKSRSRSRSRSYSKSYNSRSRSRSSRRWESRSRRSKRYSRSGERSRRRSWSRSPRDWNGRKRTRSPNWRYRSRSPYTKAARYGQSHMSTRYMSRHRSMEEIERDVQERRVIYVGAIEEGTTRADLRRRFEKFGQIVDINIHFRERGDNYGFVTFKYREHAYQALEHGNDDPSLPKYNLCFGGRRSFCKVQYSDLDAQSEDYGYHTTPSTMDYDTLLKAALQMRR